MPTDPANKPIKNRVASDGLVIRRKSQIALLAFICAVFFASTILFAHLATKDLSLLSNTLSRYALDEHGFILVLGFYAIGLTQLLLALLLFNGSKNTGVSSSCLVLSGLGVIVVAIFPAQLPPATIIERLPHIVGAVLQFLFFPLAALTLSSKMAARPRKTTTRLTGNITGILFIIILVLFISPSMKDFGYFGLIEKVDILIINFWLIFISFTLYKTKTDNNLNPDRFQS